MIQAVAAFCCGDCPVLWTSCVISDHVSGTCTMLVVAAKYYQRSSTYGVLQVFSVFSNKVLDILIRRETLEAVSDVHPASLCRRL